MVNITDIIKEIAFEEAIENGNIRLRMALELDYP